MPARGHRFAHKMIFRKELRTSYEARIDPELVGRAKYENHHVHIS
ncbi:hypothetical protein FTUN_3403 [Frigoriglobus tundricola]|uniref:Uncharacterized protein n=1 Tax=Frigoriglobus tundricola TaxID=2774151 RepID=A0A6M5YP56_9BACT|nr:hypothetical protein FTUN_3403 [Frigoriglobus tundricola]